MALLARTLSDAPVEETRDWLVTEIAPHQFSAHRSALVQGNWTGWFDMAVWLKTPAGAMQPLQLELVYRDGAGEQRVAIDRCPVGGHRTVLLNASLPLTISGRVQWAAFVLKRLAPEAKVSLDLCHLVPQERRQRFA